MVKLGESEHYCLVLSPADMNFPRLSRAPLREETTFSTVSGDIVSATGAWTDSISTGGSGISGVSGTGDGAVTTSSSANMLEINMTKVQSRCGWVQISLGILAVVIFFVKVISLPGSHAGICAVLFILFVTSISAGITGIRSRNVSSIRCPFWCIFFSKFSIILSILALYLTIDKLMKCGGEHIDCTARHIAMDFLSVVTCAAEFGTAFIQTLDACRELCRVGWMKKSSSKQQQFTKPKTTVTDQTKLYPRLV